MKGLAAVENFNGGYAKPKFDPLGWPKCKKKLSSDSEGPGGCGEFLWQLAKPDFDPPWMAK